MPVPSSPRLPPGSAVVSAWRSHFTYLTCVESARASLEFAGLSSVQVVVLRLEALPMAVTRGRRPCSRPEEKRFIKVAVILATKGPPQAKVVEDEPRLGTTLGTVGREGRGEDSGVFFISFPRPTLAPTK